MADINLLPWREAKKVKQNKQFKQQLFFILLFAMLSALLVRQFYQYQLAQQQQKNQQQLQKIQALSPQLTELNQMVTRQTLLRNHLQFIEQLTSQQKNGVAIWQTLATAKPDKLYFTQIKNEGNQVVLFGRASNANQVTLLTDNLNRSDWFDVTMVRNISQDLVYPELVMFEVACQFKLLVKPSTSNSSQPPKEQESPL